MNVFKRLFSRKNKNSVSKDNGSGPKSMTKKASAIADSNNINSNILNGIYVEDVSILRIDDISLAKHDKLALDTNPADGKSGDRTMSHEIVNVDSISSTGTEAFVAIKETVKSTDSNNIDIIDSNNIDVIDSVTSDITDIVTLNGTDIITAVTTDDHSLDSEIQTLPAITKGMCNIDSVAGIEEILNQIIKELNKIIIERERLKRKLKLKGNSYKLVARKFNTLLNNRAYKPIKMA